LKFQKLHKFQRVAPCALLFWCSLYVTVIPESKANAAIRDEIAERAQIQTGNSGAAAGGAAGFATPVGKDECAADGVSLE
jgi:hypothetical protein